MSTEYVSSIENVWMYWIKYYLVYNLSSDLNKFVHLVHTNYHCYVVIISEPQAAQSTSKGSSLLKSHCQNLLAKSLQLTLSKFITPAETCRLSLIRLVSYSLFQSRKVIGYNGSNEKKYMCTVLKISIRPQLKLYTCKINVMYKNTDLSKHLKYNWLNINNFILCFCWNVANKYLVFVAIQHQTWRGLYFKMAASIRWSALLSHSRSQPAKKKWNALQEHTIHWQRAPKIISCILFKNDTFIAKGARDLPGIHVKLV